MTAELHIDFETRSAVDLRKCGVHVYAEDPTTDIWCMAYSFGGEPELWLPGEPVPVDVFYHIDQGGHMVAHNAVFEITIWREVLVKRYGFPAAPADRWRCTMAQAYAMALPGALSDAAGALGLDQDKDLAGHRIMMSMCKPRKAIGMLPARSRVDDKPDADGWQEFIGADGQALKIRWWVDVERKQKLFDYCKQDVRTEMALDERLLRLRPQEQRLWVLDQKINDRGVFVDEVACRAAMDIVQRARAAGNKELREVTDFKISATTAVAQILDFLSNMGVELPGLAKDQVAEALTWDLPPVARRVLELRQSGARMSVSKIKALLDRRSKDGRAKGMLQYHAASTGRWGGRGFQPQNLKRPGVDQDTIEFLIGVLRSGHSGDHMFDVFNALVDDPIEALGDCIRGLLTVEDGA